MSSSSSLSSTRPPRFLTRFETSKSNRVKGLSFHPKRPWLLASLHNGCIQLWDYRMEVLLDKFEEHEGPVRGVSFHSTQPIFVSGGDDYKIKVWNYQQRRCLFNLLGHLDYIRTVEFHPEYPWILSASDDQTIRIWNWQNRQCMSTLTGHNHYVMCARWHPKEDLILSASLDQTVRVWDFSGLRKRHVAIASDFSSRMIPGMGGMGSSPHANSNGSSGGSDDIFGGVDVVVKHVLEGHTRGVNWASFHRTLSLIVSGADDREVKLWRMNDNKAWEVDTMRGHLSNVSCVVFHPKKELIISNSEDRTIRVWDISKQTNPQVYRRENDRYWILDAHPTENLIAAGHDSGLIVFKLNRERPAHDCNDGKILYFYRDQYICEYNYKTGKDKPIFSTRKRGNQQPTYRTLNYNHTNKSEHCILLTSDSDGSYELFVLRKDQNNNNNNMNYEDTVMKGTGKNAVFVSRNRFAVLDKSRQLVLKTLKNEVKRKITIPNVNIHSIYTGGLGRLLIRTGESILLYDIQSLKIISEFLYQSRHSIKFCLWSSSYQYLALFSKTNIYILDNKLAELCSVTESSKIKSGIWDNDTGVFIYTTSTHIKYLLSNGEHGIIRTLDTPIYLVQASSTDIHYLDRECRPAKIPIDSTEYQFKVSLMKRRNREVLKLMQSKKLTGDAIIAYLHKKGFPEVALHFVEDLKIKFDLALECGNINVALECAKELNNDDRWHKLGVEALRQGNHQVVESAYQRTKNFDRLSFLYLITGNTDRLTKMLHIAGERGDLSGRFHNSLYLGNVEERIQVLRDAGQLRLAWLTARTHGLEDIAAALGEELGDKLPGNIIISNDSKLFIPPFPILKETNWPLLEVRKGFFEQLDAPELDDGTADSAAAEVSRAAKYEDSGDEKDYNDTRGGAGGDALEWGDNGDDDLLGIKEDKKKKEKAQAAKQQDLTSVGDAWGGDMDIDLAGEDVDVSPSTASSSAASGSGSDFFVMPLSGKSTVQKWSNQSSTPADCIATGNFDMAMHLLNRQGGIVNFTPLKRFFIEIYNSSSVLLPLLPGLPPIPSYLARPQGDVKHNGDLHLPEICLKLEHLNDPLKNAYKSVTEGKFQAALEEFRGILHTIPFIVIDKKIKVNEINDIISTCKEYIQAMRIEVTRKESVDTQRQCLLSCLFTHTKLQSQHAVLGLRNAVLCSWKLNNYSMCSQFCRRILEMVQGASGATMEKLVDIPKIKNILSVCEKKGNKDEVTIDFPFDTAFNICAKSFVIIPKSKQSVKCPYCLSVYSTQYDEFLCSNCEIAKVGAEATGIKHIHEG